MEPEVMPFAAWDFVSAPIRPRARFAGQSQALMGASTSASSAEQQDAPGAAEQPAESTADSPPEPVTSWTVKDPGSVKPPTSNDYNTWTVEQLRKECTQRKLRMPRTVPNKDRIQRMLDYDAACANVRAAVQDEPADAPSPRKTKHCAFCLVNILFSDKFSTRFVQEGVNPSRQQLDAGEVNAKSPFWRDVATEFANNTTDYSDLVSDSSRFSDIDASLRLAHRASKLYDIWRALDGNYIKASARFKRSGNHSDDFFAFCDGRGDVYYLHVWLQIKRDLTQFVVGGLREEDKFDSLSGQTSGNKRKISNSSSLPASKQWKSDLVRCVKMLTGHLTSTTPPSKNPEKAVCASRSTAAVLSDLSSLLDNMMKLHQLIRATKEHVRELQNDGDDASAETASLAIYRKTLAQLERQLQQN